MIRIYLAIALLYCHLSNAQHELRGYIKDNEGLPFQYIIVLIEQTSQSAITDESGYYIIKDIAPGTYALSVDYLYDKQYFTVTIPADNSNFDIRLTRRIEFNEILVKGYQMDVSKYSNASQLNAEALESLEEEKDLPYVLKKISGVVVQSDAGNGIGYSGIRLRGLDPSHVQVNINGIPFNDSESSLSYFVDIPDIISHTEEITVFKGNVPNRAGTPSFGGAIDINTNKLVFEPFFKIKTQFGSFNSSKYSILANSGLLDNKYNVEFGLSRQKSDGYLDRSDSDLKSFRISGAIIKKKYSLRLNYMHGSERTGQAWNGLPVQYENIDSLRRYNSAGTEKPGDPYEDEKDNYKQDHIQLFYQNQLTNKIILNTSFNYTRGSGYFENYKSSQNLSAYYIESADTLIADLVRRQWLENDFVFANVGLHITVNDKLTLTPGISFSRYDGDHFGNVAWVNLSNYTYTKNRYYENNGIKNEISVNLKSSYKSSEKFNINLDLQFRNIGNKIEGELSNHNLRHINKSYKLFNPKVFAEYVLNKNLHFYSSFGFMEREPFREELIAEVSALRPEELFDIEVGLKYNNFKVNGYWMHYNRQLALSGKLNDVGEALRINLDKSYRIGIEFEGECKITDWFSIWNASNFSVNKISKIIEAIPIYNSNYELTGYDERLHNNSTISFSPSQVIHSGIHLRLKQESKKYPKIFMGFNHYYVSDFYLDNYSSESALIHSYQNIEYSLNIEKSIRKIGSIKVWLTIYNVLDEKYSSHGWISKFKSTENVDTTLDPYLGFNSKGVFNYYKGIFPQALRHFNIGISLNFH